MSDWVEVPTKGAGHESDWETVDDSKFNPKDEGMSKSQTALEHFGNGASFGYLPQLQAMAEKGGDAIGEAKDKALDIVGLDHLASIDHQLQQKGFKLPDSTYLDVRDHNIKRLKKEAEDNPWTAGLSNVGGGVATGIATGGLMPKAAAATAMSRIRNAGQIGGIYGAAMNPGDKEGEIAPVQFADRMDNAAKGTALGGITAGAVEGAKNIPGSLKDFAEKAAVNSTGATGLQASKFEDDAGRQLLDRGHVRFGDSQAKIAERVSGAVDTANAQIDAALQKLEAQGVKVDTTKVRRELVDKVRDMAGDSSQHDIVKLINSEIGNIADAAEVRGSSDLGIAAAEKTKRGYGRKAGNWLDPEKGQAGKEAYLTMRDAVEEAAQQADPATAALFKEGKKTHGLLAPIREAAERRAQTTAQSPPGGFLDVAAGAMGGATGGPVGAVATPIARRLISPRISSSAAVTADKASKFLMGIPKFAQLAESNPSAFQAAVQNLNKKVPSGAGMKAAGGAQQDHVVSEDDAKQQYIEGN